MPPNTNQNNEKYLQKLEILQTFVLDIIEAETFEEVAKHIIEALESTIDPHFMMVCRVHFGVLQGHLKRKGRKEIGPVFGEGMPLDGPGIMVRAVNTGKVCNVPDTRKDPSYVRTSGDGDPHTLSEIAVPILVQGESIGVVNIEEFESHTFDESDEEILKALAGYAGVSLGNIRHSDRLRGLNRHTSQLSMITSVVEVAEHTLDAMNNTLELETCAFQLSQEGGFQTINEKGLDETILLREKALEWSSTPERFSEAEKLEFLSELKTPIIVGDEVVALLSAKSIRSDAYSEQDNELLETLANHVASAIQRIRLLEEQIHYEAKLEALHKHANDLTESTSIEMIAEYTIEVMYATLGMKSCDFYSREDQHLRLINHRGWIPDNPNQKFPLDGPGILVKTANTKKTILLSDIRKEPNYLEYGGTEVEGEETYQALSELCVPVISDDEVVAILNTESNRLDFYDERDQILLETLASHVASTIQRIRLLEKQIQYESKLETLHVHANKLADAENIEAITDYTLEAMENTLGFTWATMDLVEDNFITIVIESHSGLRSRTDTGPQPIDGPGISTRAARTGETQLVNDVRKDVDYVGTHMDDSRLSKLPESMQKVILHNREFSNGKWASLSEIEVPVKIGQTVVALLGAESLELNAFTEQDKNLLETLANHVASAMMRLKASEDRARAQKNYMSILKGAADPITVTNKDTILYANKKAAELFGYNNVTDYIGLIFYDMFTPEHKQMIRDRSARRLLNQRVPNEYEVNIQRPDGTVIPAEFHLSVIEYQGEPASLNFIRDISERKRTEARLSALHSMALELSYTGSVEEIIETTFHIIREILEFPIFSFHLLEDTGLVTVGTDGMPTLDRVFPLTGKGITTRAAREARTILLGDVRLDPDYIQGSTLTRSELAVPILLENSVLGVLNVESTKLDAFTGDDTQLVEVLAQNVGSALSRLRGAEDRKELEREILVQQVQVDQEKELGRLKNQFISTATHELRTPVTSILGFLELVLDYSSQDLPDTVRKDLNVVFRNAMRLVELTNDLLDVQRITSGRFIVNLEQVDLMNTLNEVVEELSPLFAEKQQELIVDAPNDLSVQVDEIRISQLFINLLRNANKFTPAEGNITLTVETLENHVQISVKDSGIGLSEEDIGKLFKPFPAIRHGENVSSTGLGLAICKGIVDLHNGDIWVESDGLGKGCTFFVRIPVG